MINFRKTVHFLLCAFLALVVFSCKAENGTDTLVSAIMDLNGKFSPFTAESSYDSDVQSLVLGDAVIGCDRQGLLVYNGIEGETREYNGANYFYNGLADITLIRDEDADTTTYNFKLRQGVNFSDGVEMTIDDFIFSLYVFLDTSYTGGSTIYSIGIQGVNEYRTKPSDSRAAVDYISGIKKINKYEADITIDGVNASAIYRMAIQPAPLHYYGDTSQYDYDNHKFGFPRGDLSIIYKKDSTPMGAGPYKFVKFENKVVYYEANENYWRGPPKAKKFQYKVTLEPDSITAVTTGAVDISSPGFSKEKIAEIKSHNSGKQLNGNVITSSAVDSLGYGYIGLNAQNVSVAGDSGSNASRNLRKGIATVLSVYRDLTIDSYYGETASVINYPSSLTSWASPRKTDSDYRIAFSVDVNGNDIYTQGMSAKEKYDAANKAALGFFEAAGYKLNADRTALTEAPAGAKLAYTVLIGSGGTGNHPTFMLLTSAKEALAKIGMTIDIRDIDFNTALDAINANSAEIWVMAWRVTLDPDIYQLYHSSNVLGKGTQSNLYMISDTQLDKIMEKTRTTFDTNSSKELFHAAYNIILDWGVELPVYQAKKCDIFSTKQVNIETLPKDMTTYWGWRDEIQNIELN